MQLEVKENCPLNNFEPCKKLDCAWFIKLAGKHPQTGNDIDEYGCAVAWLPILLIENAQQSRQTGAAVESFRNEMVKQNGEVVQALRREEFISMPSSQPNGVLK